LLPGRTLSVRFSKFTVGSIVATLLSQVTLTGLYGWGHANATVASLLAIVVGAIPAFVINWKWTWSRDGRPSLVRVVLPYVLIIATGGLAATGLTTLTDHIVAPLVTSSHAWRTVILDVVYVGSYAALYVVKFALLNKVFARKQPAERQEGAVAGQGV
jgi:putative flippase GtrA